MRDLDRIRQALATASARGDSVVLATVMRVEGSVYRGAGARMLVMPDGATVGAVSGGCLEADIVARSPEVTAGKTAALVRYDTRASDDVVLGLGLGCQGIIDVLLEPLSGTVLDETRGFYERLAAFRDRVTLLTVVRDAGAHGPVVGTRLVLDERGTIIEGDEALLAHERHMAREIIRPAVSFVVFGGGSDAIPLVRLAKQTGWSVTVIDHRSAFATSDRFPEADRVICANLGDDAHALDGRVILDGRTMGVTMAHSATHDRAYLCALLDAGARYIGVLGPRQRTLELLGDRARSGPDPLPPNVYAPVGLDVGAESPEEIAIAIVAEVAAVNAGRSAGSLRARQGPLHDRASS